MRWERNPATGELTHVPVMVAEVVAALHVAADGVYVDCTFGRGGHSRAILGRLGPRGRMIALDRDGEAVASGAALAATDPRFTLIRSSFDALAEVAAGQEVAGSVNGVLFDLGVSSPQLDDPARGFSFRDDGPLDMRMDRDAGPSAGEWLAQAAEEEITRVLRELGEERFARRIARRIVAERAEEPIRRTARLAAIVDQAIPRRGRGDKHPATRTFQALRIHVNRELETLGRALAQTPGVLAPAGRLVVVSFHSLEDRMVKRFMRDPDGAGPAPRGLPITGTGPVPSLVPVARVRRPAPAEVDSNPRSRSAVLRVAERTH